MRLRLIREVETKAEAERGGIGNKLSLVVGKNDNHIEYSSIALLRESYAQMTIISGEPEAVALMLERKAAEIRRTAARRVI